MISANINVHYSLEIYVLLLLLMIMLLFVGIHPNVSSGVGSAVLVQQTWLVAGAVSGERNCLGNWGATFFVAS